jgi:hypothetical protein
VTEFWRERNLQLVPYVDPDGAAARSLGVGPERTGLPVTVLVDRRGNVASVLVGQVSAGQLEGGLDRITGE